MNYKDYYQALDVDKKASEKEIKSAYRKLARQYHPDVNSEKDAEDRFKEINEAYEVLGNADQRAKYDQLGSDWQHWQQGGGRATDYDWSRWQTGGGGQRTYVRYGDGGASGGMGDMFGDRGGASFSDFFEAIFGNMNAQAGGRTQPGKDLRADVEISLAEASQGTERLLDVNGRRLKVKIPAGTDSGSKIRLSGQGESRTPNGQAGDLYLQVKVAPDLRFERKGQDLHTTVEVDLYTAVLGGEIRVPTLTGAVNLKIPAGIQNQRIFRLRGKGLPQQGKPDHLGDLYAKIEVQVPTNLNEAQTALFEQLQQLSQPVHAS